MLKTFFLISFFILITISVNGQIVENISAYPDSTKKIQLVDAACGQCQFQLPGKNCSLAVRFNGKTFFVDGTSIDAHGDAHAVDGFCNSIRKAEMQGAVVRGRFQVSYFKLVDQEKARLPLR